MHKHLRFLQRKVYHLDRVLMGHADVGQDADEERDSLIANSGGYVGFDTIGYDTEMDGAPYWSRPRKSV